MYEVHLHSSHPKIGQVHSQDSPLWVFCMVAGPDPHLFERTLQLISTHGDKNSYREYSVTWCRIIIWLNKVTTIGVRYRSVRSS